MISGENILETAQENLLKSTGFNALSAAEIEFYLLDKPDFHNEVLAMIMLCCKKENIELFKIENESSQGQKEISLTPKAPLDTARNIIKLKNIIHDCAQKMAIELDMSPKPFDNQHGNGLHIHISLLDKNGQKPMQKITKNDINESPIMLYAIGGLCEKMLESMVDFAPTEDSYKRYIATYDSPDITNNHNNAPINVSWGGNNRTCAIRIPTSTLSPENRHIEHRVPSIDANPYLAIATIIEGITYGITNKITPPERVFGNAFDAQYDLVALPKSLHHARLL